MSVFRYQVYQALGQAKEAFLERVRREAAAHALAPELRGVVALTGSQSVRPAFLLPEIAERIASGARNPTGLTAYLDEIRLRVKQHYGDDWDAVPVCTCEAALGLCLELFAAPPLAGRGSGYRSVYLALNEAYSEHHLTYGRPFPPKYKDLFGERINTGGELGLMGHRLNDLDVAIVPVAGARYQVHGIRPFVVPMLTRADPAATLAALGERAERFADRLSAVVSLGYDTPGYGYGAKRDGVNPDLMRGLGAIAERFDIPYLIDNARALPFHGYHPGDVGASLMLFSMDKVAGAPTSGLIVGREDLIVQVRRALGWHGDRVGSGPLAYGKGAFSHLDPGREALVGQVAALRWLTEHGDIVRGNVRLLDALMGEAIAPLVARHPAGVARAATCNGYGVELCYVDTWLEGVGLPVFNNEDKVVGSNLLNAGLQALGWQAPSSEDGNVFVTLGRGLVDENGRLMEERTRAALAAMVRVLEILDDTTRGIVARLGERA